MSLLISVVETLLLPLLLPLSSHTPLTPTHTHTLFSVGKIGWVVLKKEVVYDELSY